MQQQAALMASVAQGGYLNDFESQVMEYDCEMVLSPVKGAQLAMTITGDSMSPEYPNGSRVLLKKINDKAFIEWGRTYVLDTENGAVVKNVHPCPNDDSSVMCRSVNPNYEPFKVKKTSMFPFSTNFFPNTVISKIKLSFSLIREGKGEKHHEIYL